MRVWCAVAAAVALTAASPASASPPANDNRAEAELLPTFPAAATGTTAEATVERLDPQVSDCGRIEGTVWYRIDAAPDGRVVVTVRAHPGLAPVVRVFRRGTSAITEVDCGVAPDGGTVVTSVETVRGAGYLVLVGRRPGTGDGGFDLAAELFLPPNNDRVRDAQPLGRLPTTIEATTLGATGDSSDGEQCGLSGGSIWYSFSGSARRIVVQLKAHGELDAAIAVYERVRSQLESDGCRATDRKGEATVAVDTRRGGRYVVVVGQRGGSRPGNFTLTALEAEAPEGLRRGRRLPAGGVGSTVHGLTDVNDVWLADLRVGVTYLIALSSRDCATLALRPMQGGGRSARPLLQLRCHDFTSFTPGPGRGGPYSFEVVAAVPPRSQPYRLRLARAGADDIGVGVSLTNGRSVRGRLAPRGADLVDIYHFDVSRSSDVRLGFSQSGSGGTLILLRDNGGRIAESDGTIGRRVERGRYVVAVRGRVGDAATRYRLSLLVRDVTSTALAVAGAGAVEVGPGSTVLLAPSVSPTPSGGTVVLQIDRLDPLTGWHFHRLYRVPAGQSVAWRPPALGRWRARASFLGTGRSSPSRSGYAYVIVATPLR